MDDFPSLTGRCIIVTGGSRGLGRAMVCGLLREGARVAAVCTGPSLPAEETLRQAHEIAPATGSLLVFGDVSRAADCQRIVAAVTSAFGRVDVLVNNAALRTDYPGQPFWKIRSADWLRIAHTNCDSVFLMSAAVAPQMIQRGAGKIINITTNGRTMVRENFSPYGPSKAFVEACTRAWAAELKGTGVTVNALLPGGLVDTSADVPGATPRQDGGQLSAAVMVKPLLWLAADDSNGISGQRFVASRWDPQLGPAARVAAAREGDGTAAPSIM